MDELEEVLSRQHAHGATRARFLPFGALLLPFLFFFYAFLTTQYSTHKLSFAHSDDDQQQLVAQALMKVSSQRPIIIIQTRATDRNCKLCNTFTRTNEPLAGSASFVVPRKKEKKERIVRALDRRLAECACAPAPRLTPP